jgi:hypothetical protein
MGLVQLQVDVPFAAHAGRGAVKGTIRDREIAAVNPRNLGCYSKSYSSSVCNGFRGYETHACCLGHFLT